MSGFFNSEIIRIILTIILVLFSLRLIRRGIRKIQKKYNIKPSRRLFYTSVTVFLLSTFASFYTLINYDRVKNYLIVLIVISYILVRFSFDYKKG